MVNWFAQESEMKEFVSPLLMGPSSLILLEELVSHLTIKEGMKILDLGCGTGLTSIYLAKKYGNQVIAADLWISPTDNARRFNQLEVDHIVTPIYAEAHQLPFAESYFDIIIAVDSYHYFGHKDNYLDEYLIKHLKPGGVIAIAIPGLQEHCNNTPPETLLPFWSDDMHFFSASWWHKHWSKSHALEASSINAFELQSHQIAWNEWLSTENEYAIGDRKFIAADNGEFISSVAVIARKKQ